ncbi:MAG: hypothetical protein AAGM22_16500, partial [Acidobacteriota bacterium]
MRRAHTPPKSFPRRRLVSRFVPGLRLWGSALLGAMLAGCGGAPPAQPSLDVAYAGCIRAQPGPVCFLDDGARFRLWARSPDGAELSVSGPVEVVESQEIEGGRLFVVRALAPDGEAIVTASAPEGPERFVLAFRPTPPPSPAIAEAERLFGEGDLAGASDALDRGWGAIPPTELGPAWRVRGRLAAALGDPEAASESMREAIDAMRSAGWLHQSAGAVAELAYGLIYQTDRFSDARSLLEAESLHRDAPAEARYGLSYLRGLLAINTGDMRGALQHLGDSVDVARRLGLEAWRMSAEQPLAHQLQRVGRGAEAAAIFSRHRRELPPDLGPCDRASLLNNLAWNQLLIRESGDAFGSEGEDPTAWLLEAREAFRDRPCVETDERANVEMNLALAALHRGDPEQARGHLENAAALEERPNLRSRFWRIEIEARLAMASGQPAVALEKYRQLESLAADALASRTLWHSEAGQARALWALGDTQAALEAYENAERHLDAASLAVPIDSGREGFVDRGLQVTRHHLDLLVELGQVERAFVLARRARSRVLRSLHRHSRLSRLSVDEQQLWDAAIGAYRKERRAFDALSVEDWTLSVEQLQRRLHEREQERSRLQQALDAAFATLDTLSPAIDESLPALAGGEVRLLFFPVGRGWIGFAESARGVVARRLESVAPGAEASALGEALLGPFTAVLEGASSVRLLPFAWLRDVDLHALPVGGGPPLVERSPVVFGLDLPREAAAPPPG